VRLLGFVFLFYFSSSLFGACVTLSEIQQSSEYQAAKKYISDYLPDLAIPRIEKILAREDLNESARATLLTLLGEAQIRAGTSWHCTQNARRSAFERIQPRPSLEELLTSQNG
jgi:hypothetical protein